MACSLVNSAYLSKPKTSLSRSFTSVTVSASETSRTFCCWTTGTRRLSPDRTRSLTLFGIAILLPRCPKRLETCAPRSARIRHGRSFDLHRPTSARGSQKAIRYKTVVGAAPSPQPLRQWRRRPVAGEPPERVTLLYDP